MRSAVAVARVLLARVLPFLGTVLNLASGLFARRVLIGVRRLFLFMIIEKRHSTKSQCSRVAVRFFSWGPLVVVESAHRHGNGTWENAGCDGRNSPALGNWSTAEASPRPSRQIVNTG